MLEDLEYPPRLVDGEALRDDPAGEPAGREYLLQPRPVRAELPALGELNQADEQGAAAAFVEERPASAGSPLLARPDERSGKRAGCRRTRGPRTPARGPALAGRDQRQCDRRRAASGSVSRSSQRRTRPPTRTGPARARTRAGSRAARRRRAPGGPRPDLRQHDRPRGFHGLGGAPVRAASCERLPGHPRSPSGPSRAVSSSTPMEAPSSRPAPAVASRKLYLPRQRSAGELRPDLLLRPGSPARRYCTREPLPPPIRR